MKPKKTGYQKTLEFLKKYEGFKDTVYLDGNGIPTIGYGFTDPSLVKKGYISRADADKRLEQEVRTIEKELRSKVKGWENLTDDSKTALLSYRFNYPAGFKDTTRFMLNWNAGDYSAAIKEVDAGMNDENNPGLRERRLAEQALLNADPYLQGAKTQVTDNGKKMTFPRGYWDIPQYESTYLLPKQTNTVYPLNPNDRTVPSLDAWNGADSPSAGPNMPSLQKSMDERKRMFDLFSDNAIAIGKKKTLPNLRNVLDRKMEDYVAGIMGVPDVYEEPGYTYTPMMYSPMPVFADGKLPKFEGGKPEDDIIQYTKNGALYNVNKNVVGAKELSVTTPEVVVTGTDRRPLYLRYDAPNSSYNTDDIVKGFNILTLGGLNNLSPTQWARRGYDLVNGNLTSDSWLNGNNGIVSNKFAQDHPYYSTLFNTIGDGLIGAFTVLSARVLNQLRPQNLGKHFYYNVNPLGYDNIIKLAKGIAKTVLKGSEPDIENPIWDTPGAFKTAASEYGVPEDIFRKARIDAWRMHTNIPQKYNTFTPSKRVPGAYTAERDVSRMMEPDILEDENIIKMLKEDKGVGNDFFNGSGGKVGFVNYDLGRTLNGDKLGVLVTDDVWDIQPFSRIDYGNGLGSRLTKRTTQKLLKKILPIKSKITKKLNDWLYKYDEKGYLDWFDKQPADVLTYVYKPFVMDENFKKQRPILNPILNLAIKTINKGTTKISDFDRWLRKTLNNKAKNFEVGSLYKGSPFRVINEFPYTRALNVNDLGLMNPGSMYSYRGGFDTKDILPTLAHDYHIKGILPTNINDNIPSQLVYK